MTRRNPLKGNFSKIFRFLSRGTSSAQKLLLTIQVEGQLTQSRSDIQVWWRSQKKYLPDEGFFFVVGLSPQLKQEFFSMRAVKRQILGCLIMQMS